MIFSRKTIENSKYGRLLLEYVRNPLYRNSFFLLANTVLTSGLGFFFWMLVAHFYNVADVGTAAAVISAVNLLSILSLVGLGDAIIRFLPSSEKPTEMINSCITLSAACAVALAAIFIAGMGLWSPALIFIRGNTITLVAFILLILVWTASSITDTVFIAGRKADFVLYKNTAISIMKLPLAALLAFSLHSFGIVGSQGIATAVAVLVSLFSLVPRMQKQYRFIPAVNFKIVRKIIPYSAGNHIAVILDVTSNQFLSIMVANTLGSEQNAYFYMAWMIANLLFTIPAAASTSLIVEGSHFENELEKKIGEALRFNFALMVPGIILIQLLAGFMLGLFGAGYSANGALLLRVLAVSGIFSCVNGVYGSILRLKNRIKEIEIIVIFKAIALVAGCYFILPVTGITGVGYVWTAIQDLIAIYVLFAMKTVRKAKTTPEIPGSESNEKAK